MKGATGTKLSMNKMNNPCKTPFAFGKGCFVALFFLLVSLASCAPEVFDISPELNPPLGLTAQVTNQKILLIWSGLNDESLYFSGYQILVSSNTNSLTDGTMLLYTNGGSLSLVTYPTSYVLVAQKYQFYLQNYVDGTPFRTNVFYYFQVKAYSQAYTTNSLPSNPASVLFVTN